MRHSTWPGAALILALASACASTITAPSARQLADSRAAVRAAEEMGAARDPQAALYLQLAREHLMRADELAELGADLAANRALERAEVDAELALVLAQEANQRAQAAVVQRRIGEARTRINVETRP